MPANVVDATIKGAELESELHIAGGLLIDASIAHAAQRLPLTSEQFANANRR